MNEVQKSQCVVSGEYVACHFVLGYGCETLIQNLLEPHDHCDRCYFGKEDGWGPAAGNDPMHRIMLILSDRKNI
jgi:hypothetical protein